MNFYCTYHKGDDVLLVRIEPELEYSIKMEKIIQQISGGTTINTSFKMESGRLLEDKKTLSVFPLIDFAGKPEEYSVRFAKQFPGVDLYNEVYTKMPKGEFKDFIVNFYEDGAGGYYTKEYCSLCASNIDKDSI